jgi:hypothetical protein
MNQIEINTTDSDHKTTTTTTTKSRTNIRFQYSIQIFETYLRAGMIDEFVYGKYG